MNGSAFRLTAAASILNAAAVSRFYLKGIFIQFQLEFMALRIHY